MMKKLGHNAITAREKNIALIIRLMVRLGVCSRADLAEQTGLTQASITYITKDLIDWGLIYETGVMEGKTRHPSIGLRIRPEKFNLIGIQINRDYVLAGIFTVDGQLQQQKAIRFSEPQKPDVMMHSVFSCLDALLAQKEESTVLVGCGVALPGPFLPDRGKIELMSGAPDWSGTDIGSEISKRLGIPVILEHDANCGALAELWYGNANTERNILYVNVADGIGAGIICDGKLYRGQIGTAGEIGHMSLNFAGPRCECGNRGCLELYCSLKKLKQEYDAILFEEAAEDEHCSHAEEILRLAAKRSPYALRALERNVSYLGIGLANLVNVLNPGIIILADRFAMAGEVLTELVQKHMRRYLLPSIAENVEIRLASEPRDIIMLRGAVAAVLEQLLKDPNLYFGGVRDADGSDH